MKVPTLYQLTAQATKCFNAAAQSVSQPLSSTLSIDVRPCTCISAIIRLESTTLSFRDLQ